MTCRSTARGRPPLVLLPILFLLLPSSGRADYIANWGPDIPTVYSDHTAWQVNLSDEAQTGTLSGRTTLTAAVLTTGSVNPAIATGADAFSQGQKAALGLDIVDGTQHGNVSFPVAISGSLAGSGSGLGLNFPEGQTKSVDVNGHHYTVALLGPGSVPGTLQASIDDGTTATTPLPPLPPPPPTGTGSNSGNGGGTPNAPEPSALVLAGLGLAVLGGGWWKMSGRSKGATALAV